MSIDWQDEYLIGWEEGGRVTQAKLTSRDPRSKNWVLVYQGEIMQPDWLGGPVNLTTDKPEVVELGRIMGYEVTLISSVPSVRVRKVKTGRPRLPEGARRLPRGISMTSAGWTALDKISREHTHSSMGATVEFLMEHWIRSRG